MSEIQVCVSDDSVSGILFPFSRCLCSLEENVHLYSAASKASDLLFLVIFFPAPEKIIFLQKNKTLL